MTSSKGNIFRVTGPLCGNSLVTSKFPSQWPVTRSFDVFLDLRLNKRLSKQLWGWWFEMPSHSLWHHCKEVDINGMICLKAYYIYHKAPTPPLPSLSALPGLWVCRPHQVEMGFFLCVWWGPEYSSHAILAETGTGKKVGSRRQSGIEICLNIMLLKLHQHCLGANQVNYLS